MNTDRQEDIFDDIADERYRQHQQWGVQRHHVLVWHAILSEEVGEVAKAALDASRASTPEDEALTLAAIREELVQVAAVAVAALEHFDERFPDIRGR